MSYSTKQSGCLCEHRVRHYRNAVDSTGKHLHYASVDRRNVNTICNYYLYNSVITVNSSVNNWSM